MGEGWSAGPVKESRINQLIAFGQPLMAISNGRWRKVPVPMWHLPSNHDNTKLCIGHANRKPAAEQEQMNKLVQEAMNRARWREHIVDLCPGRFASTRRNCFALHRAADTRVHVHYPHAERKWQYSENFKRDISCSTLKRNIRAEIYHLKNQSWSQLE